MCTYIYGVSIYVQYIYEISISIQYIHMYEVAIPFDHVLLFPFGCTSGHPFEHIGKFQHIYLSSFNCILLHLLIQYNIDRVIYSGNTHCSNVMCLNDWYLVHNCLLVLDCIPVLLLLAILPEKPMPVMW